MKTLNTKTLALASSMAVLLALGACGKTDEQAAAQRDTTVAATDPVAERAKDDAKMAAAKADDQMKEAADATRVAGANASNTVGEKIDDATITAKVNAGFVGDKDLSALKINVDTKDGVVTLNGSAPTSQAKDRATEIAKAVKGVSSVSNNLAVKG